MACARTGFREPSPLPKTKNRVRRPDISGNQASICMTLNSVVLYLKACTIIQRKKTPVVVIQSGKPRSSSGVLPFRRPCISTGFQKLVRSIKSLSQHLVFYKEEDEEVEMEIGFPTDVQHVAHIGWDGFNGMSSKTSWDKPPAQFLTLPPFSLKQFELAMTAQAGAPPPPPPSHGPGGSWPQ
ncbi:unnamed protein product [Musa hybrid cultivar]